MIMKWLLNVGMRGKISSPNNSSSSFVHVESSPVIFNPWLNSEFSSRNKLTIFIIKLLITIKINSVLLHINFNGSQAPIQ